MATSTEFSKPLNQDISEKADKVSSATNGHFAGLDSNGNLTDSGKSATDFVGAPSFYATEMPMSSSDSTKVSQAIAKLNSGNNLTNDILASALTVTESTFFNGSGSAYTGTVPSTNMRYGVFHVDVRSSRKFVTAIGTGGEVAVNTYDGSSWSGWQELVLKSDFVPTAFTAPTNLGTGVTVKSGGYVKIGNMVVVNCRFDMSSAIQSNIAKFPATGLSTTHVSIVNNKGVDMGIDTNGYLNAGASLATGITVISGIYFCI